MADDDRMHCQEVFLRHTRGDYSYITQHQTWDAERLIANMQAEARKDTEHRKVITLATREEYRERHWSRRPS